MDIILTALLTYRHTQDLCSGLEINLTNEGSKDLSIHSHAIDRLVNVCLHLSLYIRHVLKGFCICISKRKETKNLHTTEPKNLFRPAKNKKIGFHQNLTFARN